MEARRGTAIVAEAMRRQIISPLRNVLVGFVAMHAMLDASDPMPHNLRAPAERREF